MDTRLENGDFVRNHLGMPLVVTGAQELLQRALIRLCVRKGSFALDPALGSRLHTLRGESREHRQEAARLLAQEALLPMPEVTVEGAAVEVAPDGESAWVKVALSAEQVKKEVSIAI